MDLKKILLGGCMLACGCAIAAGEVAFDKIAVEPLAGTSSSDMPREFIASGKQVEVHFFSYREADSVAIDSFPEPPVIVRDKTSSAQCEIDDGGIWARAEVYLSADERYVLMNEFSGSGGDLVAYDTRTCKEVGRLDVSDSHWEIRGTEARLGQNCSGADMASCASFKPLDLSRFVGSRNAS